LIGNHRNLRQLSISIVVLEEILWFVYIFYLRKYKIIVFVIDYRKENKWELYSWRKCLILYGLIHAYMVNPEPSIIYLILNSMYVKPKEVHVILVPSNSCNLHDQHLWMEFPNFCLNCNFVND
jgi:hypothetical protein